MTKEIVFAFIGSGIVGAAFVEIVNHFIRKKEFRNQFVLQQVEEFYGPVNILICQSEKVFELYNKYHAAYKEEYIDKKWSQNPTTQKRVSEGAQTTINLANEYLEIVEENNDKIFDIVRSKSFLIDNEHMSIIMNYYEHYLRLSYERDDNKKFKVPLTIQSQLDDVSYLPPDIIKLIKGAYSDKLRELKRI